MPPTFVSATPTCPDAFLTLPSSHRSSTDASADHRATKPRRARRRSVSLEAVTKSNTDTARATRTRPRHGWNPASDPSVRSSHEVAKSTKEVGFRPSHGHGLRVHGHGTGEGPSGRVLIIPKARSQGAHDEMGGEPAPATSGRTPPRRRAGPAARACITNHEASRSTINSPIHQITRSPDQNISSNTR
jgi:hypothetical protein